MSNNSTNNNNSNKSLEKKVVWSVIEKSSKDVPKATFKPPQPPKDQSGSK